MNLYELEDLSKVPWDDSPDSIYAHHYCEQLQRFGVNQLISNIQTKPYILHLSRLYLPVTVNFKEYRNSYVVSPWAHYSAYAREELNELPGLFVKMALRGLIHVSSSFFRTTQLNKVVIINNWMLSTNLYPEINREEIGRITEEIQIEFPGHAILWRSVNPILYPGLFEALLAKGYKMVPSRQVYVWDSDSLPAKARQKLRTDQRVLESSCYEIVHENDLTSVDMQRIEELYTLLYLDKYSQWNPQFTWNFMQIFHNNGLLTFKGLRKNGVIDAALGYFARNGIMTTPVFGYDTTIPLEQGLYRMVSLLNFECARTNRLRLNLSAGAPRFKAWRGGIPAIEYTAVCDVHLPSWRQLPWGFLQYSLNKWGIPMLDQYNQ